jgi:hypothetical protein
VAEISIDQILAKAAFVDLVHPSYSFPPFSFLLFIYLSCQAIDRPVGKGFIV